MKIILARHGQTDWNVEKRIQGSTETMLNDTGILQAEELGKTIENNYNTIDKIYSSPQKRAIMTAEVLGSILHKEVIPFSGLEEMNLGKWEGLHWPEVKSLFPKEYMEWSMHRRLTKTPCGESYQDLINRLIPALKTIVEENTKDVIIVTHSAVIMTLLSYMNHTPLNEMHQRYNIKNADITVIESSAILEL